MAPGPGWPEGSICLPPPQAAKKQKIERAAVECLTAAGFSPIELPTLEYLPAEFAAESEDRCKFVSPDGKLVGLRYDHTMSLIRFVAHNENMHLPARLFYSGVVFRRKKTVGGYVEIAQIGAEILGVAGIEADIEIVRLLAKTLAAIGVPDFMIDLGTVEMFKGIVAGTGVDPKVLASIREAILRKDAASLTHALDNCDLPQSKKKVLASLPQWFGGKEVFDRAAGAVESDRSRKGLEDLRKVYDALSLPPTKGGLGDRITVDLGVVQSLDYYTGAVFEAYARRVGQPIASGGRYDRLGEAYGKSIPATGFALSIPLLLDIVP